MPLERTVRSVLFHDGPFDETDRFLLQAPATDYQENLMFDVEGNMQKRHGSKLVTTVPNANGDPLFLHSIDDNLYTLTEDGSRTFVNGAWTQFDVPGFIASKRMELETTPVGGMGHIDFISTVVDGSTYYTVVYEVRERSSSSLLGGSTVNAPKHVMVQSYTAEGDFLFQVRLDDRQSPKVVLHADPSLRSSGWVMVLSQAISDEKVYGRAYFPSTGALGANRDPVIQPDAVFGMESHGNRASNQPMYYTRLGASLDGIGRYHAFTDVTNDQFAFITQSGGSVFGHTRDSSLGGGVDRTLFTGTGPGEGTRAGEAFDVITNDTSIFFLWGEFQPEASNGSFSEVHVSMWNSALTVQDWETTVLSTSNRVYCHGGLALSDTEFKVLWMIHDSGESGYAVGTPAFTARNVRDPNTGLSYDLLPFIDGLGSGPKQLVHHRMASRPLIVDGKIYCAVQQWADYTQMTVDVTNIDEYTSVLGAKKPKTTILACLDYDNNKIQPVAYVDAGQGKTCEYTESEFLVHNPHLQTEGGDIVLANRLALQAEDMSIFFGDFGVGAAAFRMGAQESPAEAQCRIHRITKGSDPAVPIRAARFGDGLVVSTAVPLWYDGKFFGEFGPMDAPEIIRIFDKKIDIDGFPVPHGFSTPQEGPVEEVRKFQVVVGYYDAKGNKHRSEPSTLLYGQYIDPAAANAGAAAGEWNGREVTVYFTWPLSMLPADLEYFVEIYASEEVDDDPVFIDSSQISLLEAPTSGDEVKIVFQLIRYTGGPGQGVFRNPPRTSPAVYTQGGDLAASPWPAFTESVVTSTRVFALDAVNKGNVLVSKRFEDFIAPEYNGTLSIKLGDERSLLCIGRLDDKIVVFERDDIHIIYGDGPQNDGTGEDFAVQYLSTDVGCEDQESIVECPAGLVFYRRQRGFYLLDRNMGINFIGERVGNLTRGLDVLSATLVSSEAEVRFLVRSDIPQPLPYGPDADITNVDRPPRPIFGNVPPGTDSCIVWNYEKNRWTLYTNYPGVAATIHGDQYTRLLDDWTIWQVDQADYRDPTGSSRTLLRSTWIPLDNNSQGYGRVYRMTCLGRYLSSLQRFPDGTYDACDIGVKIWYDYEEGPDVTPQFKRFSFKDFGFQPRDTGDLRGERLQFSLTPAEGKGRCQAVKLEFEELLPEADGPIVYSLGQGFEITSVNFEIGVDSRTTRHLAEAVRK